METSKSIALYQMGISQSKTYLLALLFIAGNILLPQLCHLIPQGGLIFLPIYFFTLIGAYKYGYTVGLLTAVFSPLINSALFGMPPVAVLPIILIKSTLLAISAAFIAGKSKTVALWSVGSAVVLYQAVGMIAEYFLTGSMDAALQDVRLGLPGILVQIFGGWAVLKYALRNI